MTLSKLGAALLGCALFFLPTTAFAQATAAQALLTWVDVANEDSYRVERSDDGGTTYASVGTPAQDATSFNDDNAGAGLPLNVTYCWVVYSVNAFSETASLPSCATPSAPDQVIVVLTVSPHP